MSQEMADELHAEQKKLGRELRLEELVEKGYTTHFKIGWTFFKFRLLIFVAFFVDNRKVWITIAILAALAMGIVIGIEI